MSEPEESIYRNANKVQVKNTGENDCPAYGILRIIDSDRAAGKTYLEVSRPDGTYRQTYLICGPQAIAAGKYGVAYFATQSPVWALWDSTTDTPAVGNVFGPKNDTFKLFSAGYGFRVVGTSETTPFRRVLVLQEPPACIYGKLNADLAFEATAAVQVQRFKSSTDHPDSGMTVTAEDGLLTTGLALPADSNVVLTLIGGKWIVTSSRECPA